MTDDEIQTILAAIKPENKLWAHLKLIGFIVSTVASVMFVFTMLREQDRINHRLDVGDAKEWKRLVDGNKARDVERVQLKTQIERILAHCKRTANGCGLATELTIIPVNPEIVPVEQLTARTAEGK